MPKPSNLLILMSDEHQARALGCAGHFVHTPHLDTLAARGTHFTHAYTPSPICVPARACFATGRHVHDIGHWDNSMPYAGTPPGWGHALQRKRVPVESIGKLHFRSADDRNGFDRSHMPMMVQNGVGMVYASARREHERVRPKARMLGSYIGPEESNYTRYDAAVTERAVAWLAEHGSEKTPWCLYVGLVAPHFPLVAPPEFFDLYPPDTLPPTKLHPSEGYVRHPWVEKQNAFSDSEEGFSGPEERLAAISAYHGLVSWLDHNVGRILAALDASGQSHRTTVAYASDHGDNVGARGLWGKSNMYQESVAIPLIFSGPGIPHGVCETPASLLDLSETILDHFGADLEGERPGRSLYDLIAAPPDPEREVFSEYHAVGSVSGAFMLRRARWKLVHYEGFLPELFDLKNDPEELCNLASDPGCADLLTGLQARLQQICNTAETDARAHAAQAELIRQFGGLEAAVHRTMGAGGGTPPPRF